VLHLIPLQLLKGEGLPELLKDPASPVSSMTDAGTTMPRCRDAGDGGKFQVNAPPLSPIKPWPPCQKLHDGNSNHGGRGYIRVHPTQYRQNHQNTAKQREE
jgi:hypothetical protein